MVKENAFHVLLNDETVLAFVFLYMLFYFLKVLLDENPIPPVGVLSGFDDPQRFLVLLLGCCF